MDAKDLQIINVALLADYKSQYPAGKDITKFLDVAMVHFHKADVDMSGDIDYSEIVKLFKSMGKDTSEKYLKDLISKVDDDNSGTLRYREFANLLLIEEKLISKSLEENPQQSLASQKNAQKMKGKRVGAVKKQKRGHLKIKLIVKAVGSGFEIKLHVLHGRDLMICDFTGSSDPYVKCYLFPSADKATKRKSEVFPTTLNPNFNSSFDWKLASNVELQRTYLQITVWDYDRFARNDFMGGMAFKLADVFAGVSNADGWFILLDEQQGRVQNFPSRPDEVIAFEGGAPVKRPSLMPDPKDSTPAVVRPSVAKLAASGGPKKYSTTDFNYLKVLGKGSFGKVMLAEEKTTKKLFAVKALKKLNVIKDHAVNDTLCERRVLSLPGNPLFLIQIRATFQTDQNLMYVMDLISGGDLMFHLLKVGSFPEAQSAFYTAEVSCGLWFLHERGILYRDLKLDNVMLDSEGHVKLADFGLCKEKILGDVKAGTFCGTPDYIAPEIIKHQKYQYSVDWWSLGVLCYEMLTGEAPFGGDDEAVLFKNIQFEVIQWKRWLSKDATNFLKGLLNRDPLTRLGCGPTGKQDVLAHKFFSKLNWEKLQLRQEPVPMIPAGGDPRNAGNFEADFTKEKPQFSIEDPKAVKAIDQTVFTGFSFVNA